jgi:nucleoside 2-deoxyribosyltransferase
MALESVVAPHEVYERDVGWIRAANALIAEVSVPSHGVGYEIGFALNADKPVLCLVQEGRKLSKMIEGNPDSRLRVKTYKNARQAISIAREFLASLQKMA